MNSIQSSLIQILQSIESTDSYPMSHTIPSWVPETKYHPPTGRPRKILIDIPLD
jgi:hypothetical protein